MALRRARHDRFPYRRDFDFPSSFSSRERRPSSGIQQTTGGRRGKKSAIVEVTPRGGGDGDAPRSRGDLPPSRYPHRRLFLVRTRFINRFFLRFSS